MITIPPVLRIHQRFPQLAPVDRPTTVAREFLRLQDHPSLRPGRSVAVGVGSRGITGLAEVVRAVVQEVRKSGAEPFILPAMGSHGGATPHGQCEVLASYGITEESMNVPIRSGMEVTQVGISAEGHPVVCSTQALAADGIILVNRIKPHTDFQGTLGSGLLKMLVIGLGKHAGAAAMHAVASRVGHERVLRSFARVLLATTPVIGGVAILENQFHETARIVALRAAEMEGSEATLLEESRQLMPRIPFPEVDLLVVDQLGKNISGAGMDPNIIGRSVQGYSSALTGGPGDATASSSPIIRRIFVRDLTSETHGNAIGIGLADVTTTRLVLAMDRQTTSINAFTALTPQCAKIPIYFDSDREAIERVLRSLALSDSRTARVVRIRDTLSLTEMQISDALLPEASRNDQIEIKSEPFAWDFDANGNLSE